jgi:outer membrane protein assembly factor BamB
MNKNGFLRAMGLSILASSLATAASSRSAGAAENGPQDARPLGDANFRPSPQHPFGWRGDGSGRFPAATPVRTWSAKSNVAWAAEVGESHSSPIIVGRRVFVMAEPNAVICLDAASGKELWRRAHPISALPAEWHAFEPQPPKDSAGQTAPTPVSDGRWLWIFLDSGIVACYDLDGHRRWLQWYDFKRTTGYGRTASPLLVGERLLVHFGPLVCLEAATGKLLWKNDNAKATYGTPAAARIGNVDVIITPKGQVVRTSDGKILAADLGRCAFPSPIVQGRVVYFIDHGMTAVQLPAEAGEQIDVRELWSEDLEGEFYASPLLHEGRIYTVDRTATCYVIDAASGKTLLSKVLEMPPAGRADGPSVHASVCLAGKHLLLVNNQGNAMLLEPGDKPGVVAIGTLPAGASGTPAFSGARMFLRGGKLLYCIAGGKDADSQGSAEK